MNLKKHLKSSSTMEEIWKTIVYKGTTTTYKISNRGAVVNKFGKLMTQHQNANGYLACSLYINGKQANPYVHRLVMIAFVENPDNLDIVNHINGDKTNNYLENLEWTNQSENAKHSYAINKNQKGNHREIIQYDGPDKKTVKEIFASVNEAAKKLNKSRQTISTILNKPTATDDIYLEYAEDKKTILDKDDFEHIKEYEDYLIHRDSRIYSTKMNQFMKVQVNNGYHTVLFGEKRILVHQLVARQFLPRIEGKTQVNHINGDKLYNHVNNLAWVDNSENQLHAVETGLKSTTAVKQYLLDGTFVREYASITEVKKLFGLTNCSVSQCCRKVIAQTYGYIWRYASDTEPIIPIEPTARNFKAAIIQYTLEGVFVDKFDSYDDVCDKLEINKDELVKICNTSTSIGEFLFMSNIL
jgi:ribosomal protein L22